ncbi:MAG: DNA-deoxyinosine glycosylase [Longicatena sp.]
MLKGLKPIISVEPKVLILGSMPSVTSLDKQEYYGYKQNRFWRIMEDIFQEPITSYEQKKELIITHHLVLWDVIGECERVGSLDSNIKNEVVNNIDRLLADFPSIELVVCNGKKSYDLYLKHFSSLQVPCVYLPSTSNANRSIKEEILFKQWKTALSYLNRKE